VRILPACQADSLGKDRLAADADGKRHHNRYGHRYDYWVGALTPHHNLQKYMRFSRTMREAYGYEVDLERTPPPFTHRWRYVIGAVLASALLFVAMAI
jgi:hypothetical protein